MGVESFGFGSTDIGSRFTGVTPGKLTEVVFDANFVDESEYFVLPLLGRRCDYGDGDRIFAFAIVGAGGNSGGADAADDWIATSIIVVTEPSAG